MSFPPAHRPDPTRDLTLERTVDVPPELVWAAWTQPEHVKRWFSPAPYATVESEIDLRPGGTFRNVVRSPEGEETTITGCYLDVVEGERLVWTSVLGPGYRPALDSFDPPFTAVISLAPTSSGTTYRALVVHGSAEHASRHDEMGFTQGWSAAWDQLVDVVHELRGDRAPTG